jgi:pyruvate dehydrogenase E1 component
VLKAQQILEEKFDVGCDVWSVTSYKELYRNANDCERWNMLHPGEAAKVPYVTQMLKDAPGPFIAASDYMKVLPESLGKWVPGQLVSLGTDGFGRSDTREALRRFFEVDAECVVLAALHQLVRRGQMDPSVLRRAFSELGVDPEKLNPLVS